MSIVSMLRFDQYSGGVIADEESWILERRRTYFADSILPLLDGEQEEKTGIRAFYAGVGDPHIHYDAVLKTRKILEKKDDLKTLEETGRICLACFQECHRRRIDDRLGLFYGFGARDLNRGFFEQEEERYDINQEAVKERALKILSGKEKGERNKFVPDNAALIAGFDRKKGFQAFTIKEEAGVLSFVLSGFECLGFGKYAAAQTFADHFSSRFLSQRRDGFDRVDGMILLIQSAIEASRFYVQVGGQLNIVYLDSRSKNPEEHVLQISHNRGKLSGEIVLAHTRGFLGKGKARSLIDKLIFEGADLEEVEKELSESSTNPEKLDLLLRGYKIGKGELDDLH